MNTESFFLDNNIKVEQGKYETSRDSGGVRFITVTSSGVMKDGEGPARLYAQTDLAWMDFEDSFLRWLDGRRRLHVRAAPAVIEVQYFRWLGHEPAAQTWYYVACRVTAY